MSCLFPARPRKVEQGARIKTATSKAFHQETGAIGRCFMSFADYRFPAHTLRIPSHCRARLFWRGRAGCHRRISGRERASPSGQGSPCGSVATYPDSGVLAALDEATDAVAVVAPVPLRLHWSDRCRAGACRSHRRSRRRLGLPMSRCWFTLRGTRGQTVGCRFVREGEFGWASVAKSRLGPRPHWGARRKQHKGSRRPP